MTVAPLAQRLISALAEHLHAHLQLEGGVCALYDASNREAVVIELPDHGDVAILHSSIDVPAHAPGLHKRLLELNFRLDLLGGSWLALDDKGSVRLCAHCPLAMLDEARFCHWIVGFVAQVGDIRARLAVPAPPGSPRPASLNTNRTRLG
ncbi:MULTISPECIES: type III secretion system chaperone [unclassified Pseudomonas]|uniref:type III secretion system chaperone n=1 Tax=unclassified Pseudomonas TaxID=196821 RepID=UPI0008761DA7|nr:MULTISPECIES: type III secretion system chaperone [unclassified Pseudomonas]SCZ43034.1 Tir chaperone protein (CesT) family protein [Pseudomonas sp. NFACC44-2]SDA57096.1 Tir chaperone protein (CesT) family protein [Pseudomonas sp. NFACC51]SDW18946.1 Tir chaperone protein (CesT) family protein [Pseudomonas sp. NFACC08-1]SEJ71408.1 Tir chaperone protein (CesT) family protein [Pseudomonas sp. NFACC07-1]SFI49529.1 Tir chaperone protein (CesT) family protein [Pseudomonas sp. NFACC54]